MAKTNRERILEAINQAAGPICDDCLTAHLRLPQRQQAFQRCGELERAGAIGRGQGHCLICGKVKKVSWRIGVALAEVQMAAAEESITRPVQGGGMTQRAWYWEGNVQAQIVSYLNTQGYTVLQTADTASREAGKDIVAVSPEGRELWVSVKGYPTPKGSTNTQARHWFSHAIFDLVLYHGESPGVELAIGLPAGYKTYQALAGRVEWFRRSLPFRLFWVDEAGKVRVQ